MLPIPKVPMKYERVNFVTALCVHQWLNLFMVVTSFGFSLLFQFGFFKHILLPVVMLRPLVGSKPHCHVNQNSWGFFSLYQSESRDETGEKE